MTKRTTERRVPLLAIAMLALLTQGSAQTAQTAQAAQAAQTVQPLRASGETERIVHLLNRAAFGPRPGDVERVRQMGVAKYIDEQLHPERIDDSAIDGRLSVLETLTMDPITLKARYERSQRVVVEQLQSQKIIRAIYSQRQLQEVMVDFWFNHFNVNWSKDGVQFAVTGYERDAIRPFALGKFKDLLRATAGHPAMLVYLDNALSNSAGTNENYARELMELHTLGIDGGYTQKDVEEVARIFTGWTVSADGGAFSFNGERHVPGDKVVLGRTISSGGRSEGEAVLDMLARHPRTADFISTKLVRRFVADKPPASLVQRVAQVFTETDGDIRAMITTILTSEEFRDPKAFRAKAKSPFEAVVSAMRAVDADLQASLDDRVVEGELRGLLPGDVVLTKVGRMSRVSPAIILTRAIQDMGQFPYQVPEPTGYPDRGDYWLNGSSVLRRAMFAVSLMSNEVLGTRVDVPRLQTALPVTSPSDINWNDALPVVTMPSALPPPGKPAANDPSIAVINAFALALGSPEFQHK